MKPNWDLWKSQYITNVDEIILLDFLVAKYKEIGKDIKRAFTGQHRKATKTWVEERKTYWSNIKQSIIKDNEKELRENFKISTAVLNMNHRRILDIATLMLDNSIEYEKDKKGNIKADSKGRPVIKSINMNTKELTNLYRIIKNEKGEPDRTTKELSVNSFENLDDFLNKVSDKIPDDYNNTNEPK